MKEPARLIEHNEKIAQVIAAHRRRRPSRDLVPALLKALDADAAPSSGVVPEVPRRGTRRWVGVGLAVLGVAALAAWEAHPALPREPSAIATTGPTATALPRAGVTGTLAQQDFAQQDETPAASSAGASLPLVAVDDLPSAHILPNAAAETSSAAKPTVRARNQAPKPNREVELITSARQALTQGDTDGCLLFVDRYHRDYPTGQFVLETNVMRIEATFAKGDRAEAAAMVKAFLAAHPNTHYEARLRTVLSSTEPR